MPGAAPGAQRHAHVVVGAGEAAADRDDLPAGLDVAGGARNDFAVAPDLQPQTAADLSRRRSP